MSFRKFLTFFLTLSTLFIGSFAIGLKTNPISIGNQFAFAQEDNPESGGVKSESGVDIQKPEIPGDTTILTIAAVGLVIIVMMGVLWRSRSQSRTIPSESKSRLE